MFLRNGLQLSFRLHHCSICLRPILKIFPALNSFKKKRNYCSKQDDSKKTIVDANRSEDDQKLLEKESEKHMQEENENPGEKYNLSNFFSVKKPVLKSDFPSDVEEYNKQLEQWNQYQARYSWRPKRDPTETSIVLFPGQGTQYVGMGEKFLSYPGVQEMYETASNILGYDLLNLCLNGPKQELDKTVHCQPAVFVTSLAGIQKLKEENPEAIENCVGTAGLSIGEFAALVFADIIRFEDALSLLKVRAEKMQEASEMVPSGMMTVLCNHQSKLKLAMEAAKEFCKERLGIENPVCGVATYLFTDCKVIAGHIEALDFIKDNASDFGLKGRLKPLPVSGAFHTSLMSSAVKPIYDAVKKINFDLKSQGGLRVHSNFNGKAFRHQNIVTLLAEQVVKPVKWEQIMHILYMRPQGTDFPKTYEAGPGDSLGKILKRVNEKAYKNYHNIET